MHRLKKLCITLAITLGCFLGGLTTWLGVRYVSRQRAVAAAQLVIQNFDGDFRSLPAEPIGSEYFITFRNRRFTRDELDQLVAIAPMTHREWVGINFENCHLTAKDLNHLAHLLPSADLILLTDEQQKITAEIRPRNSHLPPLPVD